MNRNLKLGLMCALFGTSLTATMASAQTRRALERRAERNERQMQRQLNRADYFSNQSWQQLDPWIKQNGVTVATPNTTARVQVTPTPSATVTTPGATVTTPGATVNAKAATRTTYGFRDANADGQWFYDYYTVAPTYYSAGKADDGYGAAIRYFDGDGDGVYDSYAQYRDTNSDGQYDEYDRLDFSGSTTADSGEPVGPAEAKRYTVNGTVKLSKTARVGDHENLVVEVHHPDYSPTAVDLGPVEAIKKYNVSIGQEITATGWIETVGEKELLVADTVTIEGQGKITIDRHSGSSLSGQIVDVKETDIHSVPHYVGVVESSQGRQLVDLGPTSTYSVAIQPSSKVVVYGVPAQTHGHTIFMADRVELAGESYVIDRVKKMSF
ncbi:MAG: hypothetical protein ACO1RT_00185 [Planctomycetaceae bacterium]